MERQASWVKLGLAGQGKWTTSLTFAAEGAKVVLSDINEEGGKETVSLIEKEGGGAIFIKADSSKAADRENLVTQAVERFGGLHIVYNNAGLGGKLTPTGEHEIETWDKAIAVNLSGDFYGRRFQIPTMLKSGGGSIVNVSSVLGSVGTPCAPCLCGC